MKFLVWIDGKEIHAKVIEAKSAASALSILVKAATPDPTKSGTEYRIKVL